MSEPQPYFRTHAPQSEEVRVLRTRLRDADLKQMQAADAKSMYEQLRHPLGLDEIEGSGADGAIVRDDYIAALEQARTRGARR